MKFIDPINGPRQKIEREIAQQTDLINRLKSELHDSQVKLTIGPGSYEERRKEYEHGKQISTDLKMAETKLKKLKNQLTVNG